EELHDRSRPAVRDEQRKGIRVRRARVDEVNRLAVDTGAEMGQLVEPHLLGAPVVCLSPVLDELAQVAHRYAVLPTRPLDLIRKAGLREAALQVLEDGVVDADLEGLDGLAHAPLRRRRTVRSANSEEWGRVFRVGRRDRGTPGPYIREHHRVSEGGTR